eukprot:6670347-Alexandrium_andersonii.AAC.1
MDKAAFDFELQPKRQLDEDARIMEKYDPIRMKNGVARQLPHEYIPVGVWPLFAPEQVIMLRRSNCRAFFRQLAQWYAQRTFGCQHQGSQEGWAGGDHCSPPFRPPPGGRVELDLCPARNGYGGGCSPLTLLTWFGATSSLTHVATTRTVAKRFLH